MNKKMKKNKAMRAAGGLFVATMLTTSVVSGTYAKYITSDDAKDNARVAVFGVKVEASGDLFGQTYLKAEDNTPDKKSNGKVSTDDTISVKSQEIYTGSNAPLTEQDGENNVRVNNVVAPGTKSSKEGLNLSVSGTPEVDVRIEFTFDSTSDIYLGENGENTYYPNMTSGKVYDNTFNMDDDVFRVVNDAYYPVKFNLEGATDFSGSTLADVENYIKKQLGNAGDVNTETADGKTTYSVVVPAGTNIGETLGLEGLTLTWEWKFDENTGAQGNKDKEDTLLGDLAYDKFANKGSGAKDDALVNGKNGAIEAIRNAIRNIPEEDSEWSDWKNGTNKLADLVDNSGKPVGGNVSTTNAYNLIANLNLSISVTQVD